MVDVLSRGRLEFGIGVGNTPADFKVYGVSREEARARFEEAGEIVAKAWGRNAFRTAGSSGNSRTWRSIRDRFSARRPRSGWPGTRPRPSAGRAAMASTS